MLPPPIPADEFERLCSLRRRPLLDTPAEERFDRLTRMGQALFGVPMALVSLVDENRQWFKSKQGLAASSTSREVSFCGHTILDDSVMWIEDASEHPDFHDNPLVTGDLHLRFYAGTPLATPEGHRIGTLCILDRKPRARSLRELQALKDLGRLVEAEIALLDTLPQDSPLEPSPLRFAPEDPADRQPLLDQDTGCWNGQGIREVVSCGLSTCAHTKQSAALLLMRAVNASTGQPAELGFEPAERVAQTLRRSVRNYDPVGRLDDSRFLSFLVGYDQAKLETLEDTLRNQMGRDAAFADGSLSLEVGHSIFNPSLHEPDATWMFESADDNLSSSPRKLTVV